MRSINELPECPVATTICLIGSKWKLLIIRNLMKRTWRFNELLRSLVGVSQKVLTTNLRELEKDGIIISVDVSSFDTEPPATEDYPSKKRNRVPFLPLEREYIMSCYYNLVESGYISKAACARMIWNEIYSNVNKDGDNEIVNAIRRPLRNMAKPDIKHDRSMRSILNLIYNRTTKRGHQ